MLILNIIIVIVVHCILYKNTILIMAILIMTKFMAILKLLHPLSTGFWSLIKIIETVDGISDWWKIGKMVLNCAVQYAQPAFALPYVA